MSNFKIRVEQSSIGTKQSQAARRTIDSQTAAAIVSKAASSAAHPRPESRRSKSVGGKRD